MTFNIAIGGHQGDPGDPLYTSPATVPLDHPALPGPIAKAQREDLQVLDYLSTLAARGLAAHPLRVDEGGDPPDRMVGVGADLWGLELTELTIQDVRSTIAPMRHAGRDLARRLREDKHAYDHLVGRAVQWTIFDEVTSHTIDVAAEALRDDRGVVNQAITFGPSGEPPATLDTSTGFYTDIPGATILVYAAGTAGPVTVTVGSTFRVLRSEATDLMAKRIARKDTGAARALLLTAGLPDETGHVCPFDTWLFQHLADESVLTSLPEPTHLDYIAISLWGTGSVIEAFSRSRPPWLRPT